MGGPTGLHPVVLGAFCLFQVDLHNFQNCSSRFSALEHMSVFQFLKILDCFVKLMFLLRGAVGTLPEAVSPHGLFDACSRALCGASGFTDTWSF